MKFNIIDGQMNIFDTSIQESIKPKKVIEQKNISELKAIINLYSDSCSRIVRTHSGALLVELENKTLYFNQNGIKNFELPKNIGIMPGEKILIANKDKNLNDLQKKKLKDLNVKEYIKRKGDSNIIIPGKTTTVINHRGWVLEYNQKPNYNENEFFITEMDDKITEFKIGDSVEIEYRGSKNIGKVTRIYNNGETLNVEWNGKSTAFYYKYVKQVAIF